MTFGSLTPAVVLGEGSSSFAVVGVVGSVVVCGVVVAI
jgi:hypothetical protein